MLRILLRDRFPSLLPLHIPRGAHEIDSLVLALVEGADEHFGEEAHEEAHDAHHAEDDAEHEEGVLDEGLALDEFAPEGVEAGEGGEAEGEEAGCAEKIHRLLLEAVEEFDGDEVGEDFEHAL